jgi:hypothetical protein
MCLTNVIGFPHSMSLLRYKNDCKKYSSIVIFKGYTYSFVSEVRFSDNKLVFPYCSDVDFWHGYKL